MIKNLILSIVSASDLLENGRLDTDERRTICDIMECNFTEADRIGIPFIVQNTALAAGANNHGRRYCLDLTIEVMQKYAHRLTPEALAEWRDFLQERGA
nr:MAG TPA: hypothetical protein [Caudoviricetes sp.]